MSLSHWLACSTQTKPPPPPGRCVDNGEMPAVFKVMLTSSALCTPELKALITAGNSFPERVLYLSAGDCFVDHLLWISEKLVHCGLASVFHASKISAWIAKWSVSIFTNFHERFLELTLFVRTAFMLRIKRWQLTCMEAVDVLFNTVLRNSE